MMGFCILYSMHTTAIRRRRYSGNTSKRASCEAQVLTVPTGTRHSTFYTKAKRKGGCSHRVNTLRGWVERNLLAKVAAIRLRRKLEGSRHQEEQGLKERG